MLRSRFALLAAAFATSLAFSTRAEAQQVQYTPQPPVYQQQPPVYQQSPPVYQQQPPVYQQQPPVYQQQPPVYQQPIYPGQPVYVQQPQQQQGPRVLKDWDPSQPIPPGYHKEEKSHKGLIIGGAVTFGALYLPTALLGGGVGGEGFLFIPALGPFLELSRVNTNGSSDDPSGSAGTAVDVLLVVDGLAQIAGITMFAIGMGSHSEEVVRNDVGGIKWQIAPVAISGGSGMGVVGTF